MHEYNPENLHSEESCIAVFHELFPDGFESADVIEELAHEGWEHSPLAAAFHPTVEQVFEEAVRFHVNMHSLFGKKDGTPPPPPPTFEEISAEFKVEPYDAPGEVRQLIGKCMWDIFSDNHEVSSPDGKVYDLGTHRRAGEFIAEYLNEISPSYGYGYMDFYMGTAWMRGRIDLMPVYQLIFTRMKRAGLDWQYFFPRLFLANLKPLQDQLKEGEGSEFEGYSPEEALKKEAEEAEKEIEREKLRKSLDDSYRESVAKALEGPAPETVTAYQSIYKRFPRGWPPVAEV